MTAYRNSGNRGTPGKNSTGTEAADGGAAGKGSAQTDDAVAGLTLIELLLVLAVAAIALGLTAAPFSDKVADLRATAAMRHLGSLLNHARYSAVLQGQRVTLCARDVHGVCQRHWDRDREIIVFVDANANRRFDAQETLLRRMRWPLHHGELSWRASLARPYIEFRPSGRTGQNGTLYYCPSSRDARQARALVLNQGGRNYLTTDSNGDGIREDRNGRNLSC